MEKNNSFIFESSEEESIKSEPFSLSIKKENASTFFGIYSIITDEGGGVGSDKSNKDNKKVVGSGSNAHELVQTTFEWPDNKNEVVYLSGSFCNWRQLFLLENNGKGGYSVTLPLKRGTYQFKFKINEEWRITDIYPKIEVENKEIRNYIDTTLPENKQEEGVTGNTSISTDKDNINNNKENNFIKKESQKITDEIESDQNNNNDNESESNEEDDVNSNFNSKSKNSFELSEEMNEEDDNDKGISYRKDEETRKKLKKIQYSLNYPKKKQCQNIPPNIPYSYDYVFDLDIFSKQSNIGKKKFYEPKEKNIFSGSNSYKSISVLPFVELNHVRSTDYEIIGDVTSCSSFIRYRNKFTTFLYYKPSC